MPFKNKVLVTVVVTTMVCLLGSFAIPNFVHSGPGKSSACVNNLRWIDGAKQQWAFAHPEATNRPPTCNDIQPYLKPRANNKAPLIPVCPEGGNYTIGRLEEAPKCSLGGAHILE
jgi:hypothetical protein